MSPMFIITYILNLKKTDIKSMTKSILGLWVYSSTGEHFICILTTQ